jgi:hypothetical protein
MNEGQIDKISWLMTVCRRQYFVDGDVSEMQPPAKSFILNRTEEIPEARLNSLQLGRMKSLFRDNHFDQTGAALRHFNRKAIIS